MSHMIAGHPAPIRAEGWRNYDYDVYRMNLETGAVERLTKKNGYATDLRVFADGKTVAFRRAGQSRYA